MLPPRVPIPRLPQTDRPYRWSLVVSIALHVLVLGFFLRQEIARQAREADDSRSPGAPGARGGGGGQTFRIELPPYQAAPAPEPEVEPAITIVRPPPPQVMPPPIKIQKLNVPTQTGTVTSSVDVSGLVGQGPGKGGGAGMGVGTGAGVDSGAGMGGEGGDVFPPTPRYTILPPLPQPASMRGRTIRVHFWVNAQGKVTRVQVEPEIKDAAYRQQFLSMMREYTFNPARRLDGTNVDGELTMPITL